MIGYKSMAATYAAVLSLTHLIDQIQLDNARRPLFHEELLEQIVSVYKLVCFLQGFLEGYDYMHGNHELDFGLESRIANAAYVAEDIINSYVVDKRQSYSLMRKTKGRTKSLCSKPMQLLWKAMEMVMKKNTLQKVIEEMDYIRKKVVMVMEKTQLKDQHPWDETSISALRPSSTQKYIMVEIDDELLQIMEKVSGEPASRVIIPITGMGGIGKTTLAKNIYDHPLITEHFDLRAYVTISQKYNVREILVSLLREVGADQQRGDLHELGLSLYKHLTGRRYFIILDDMWSVEAWNELKRFLPDNDCGSRVMVTTRLSDVANHFGSSHEMNLLDEKKSWRLLCKKVFSEKDCPPELEEVGKKIAKNCKGLPLSIAVVGGLLAKSRMTPNDWSYYAENINSVLNSEDDEYCLRILSLSYNHLPIHLKPCFLYMGIYPEDYQVRVSDLIRLWIAEGFVKSIESKSLEEAAKEYLKDLEERHLILVELGSIGEIKTCSIHDLLRNLCLMEARKERFIYVATANSSLRRTNKQRRVVLDKNWPHQSDCNPFLPCMPESYIRSVRCDYRGASTRPLNLKLMRVFNWETVNDDPKKVLRDLGNSNYLKFIFSSHQSFLLSPILRLWNLQTLVVKFVGDTEYFIFAPFDIWKLPQLRHVMVDTICLPDPQSSTNDFVLQNLQTLSKVSNFKCVEDAITRIPNIEKLKIVYILEYVDSQRGLTDYYLGNLVRLKKLQSLVCKVWFNRDFLKHAILPHSLKKLTLDCHFGLEDVATKIGPLPNLEKLMLVPIRWGKKWVPVEGQFLRLKLLRLNNCSGLLHWEVEADHFPVLEKLILKHVHDLQEIPSGIGDISTLQSIELDNCRYTIVSSARKIIEEQQDLGNDDLRLIVKEMRWA